MSRAGAGGGGRWLELRRHGSAHWRASGLGELLDPAAHDLLVGPDERGRCLELLHRFSHFEESPEVAHQEQRSNGAGLS